MEAQSVEEKIRSTENFLEDFKKLQLREEISELRKVANSYDEVVEEVTDRPVLTPQVVARRYFNPWGECIAEIDGPFAVSPFAFEPLHYDKTAIIFNPYRSMSYRITELFEQVKEIIKKEKSLV